MKKIIISTILFFLFWPPFANAGDISLSSIIIDEPGNIEELFESYARELVNLFPETVAYIGIDGKMNGKVNNDRWNDESVEAIKNISTIKRKYSQWLARYDRNRLTPSQRRAADILKYALDRDLEGEKFQDHFYLISHVNGFHDTLTTILAEYHRIETIKDANAYISRLEKYQEKIRQILDRLKIKEKNGLLPPQHIIKNYMNVLSHFIDTTPHNNILYTSFKRRIQRLNIDKDQKENLYQEVREKISSKVYPSYKEMIDNLNRLTQNTSRKAGVWRLPQGDEFYRYCLKYHTTTAMTPKEIQKIGLNEVKRIQREIKRLLASTGFNEDMSFRDLMNYYWGWQARRNREKLYYPNTNQGRIQALEDYQKHIKAIIPLLPDVFSLIPKTKLLIKPVPLYKISIAGAHYEAAPLNGKGEGIFYMNLASLPFKPGMKTLAIHEGIPGHHFQISIEREIPGIRLFRHFFFFTAFIEGWALYAEKLAMENGWFENLYQKLGYLESELLRAVRIVLDTGIHYKRWTREHALSYMQNNLGWASPGEIDRYIAWPAQACAYKIGELKILELRKLAKKKLKKKFNIKEFHTVILQQGAVPLPLLETYVKDYIFHHH
jgi:uncharacterized protein (DUF885 family)